jgi:hypothetical protein
LRVREDTDKIFDKYKPTHVIHLAAKVGGLFANMKQKVSGLWGGGMACVLVPGHTWTSILSLMEVSVGDILRFAHGGNLIKVQANDSCFYFLFSLS